MASNKITLNPSSITRVLGIVAFLLVLASIAGSLINHVLGYSYLYGLIPLFDIDTEQNIPTFFSTFLLLFAAVLLGIITILKKNQLDPYTTYWKVLSFGFLYMACDEASSIHELLIDPVHRLLGNGDLGFVHFAWVIPITIIVFALALYFIKFLLHLSLKTRLMFLLAAALYLGGAIGYELIGGRYFELHGENLTYSMITTFEESLELAGAILFDWTLLTYISDNYKEVQIQFDTDTSRKKSNLPPDNIKAD